MNPPYIGKTTIFFENGFVNDTVSLLMDEKLIEKRRITTDPSMELASVYEVTTKGGHYLVINVSGSKNVEICPAKYLIINHVDGKLIHKELSEPKVYE